MKTARWQCTCPISKLFLRVLTCLVCLWTPATHATEGPLRCSSAHAGGPFVEAEVVEQIQKNLVGNRPLLAIIRGSMSKKETRLESGLVALIRQMPASIQNQLSEKTGYAIIEGKFRLLQEVKTVDRDWANAFQKQALDVVQNLQKEAAQKLEKQSAPATPNYQVHALTTKQYTTQAAWFMNYLAQNVWKENLVTTMPKINDSEGFSNLMASQEAALYFLFVAKGMLDPDVPKLLTFQGESTVGKVADIYNAYFQNRKNAKKVTADDILHAYQEFPRMALKFQKRLFEIRNAREPKSPQEHSNTSNEVRGSSLRELIEPLSQRDASVISQNLIELIQTVDSSEKQTQNIQEVLQSEKPQLRLLEIAYTFKQYEELTQKEIQAAVYSGLNEITSPGVIEESASAEVAATEAVDKAAPDSLPVVEPSARDSKSRIAKMKRDLQSPSSDFRLFIHNEKEFFDILKPGTGRFEAVENDIEVLRQKFARVFGYFNGVRMILSGDGHFSNTNRRIFDLKYGQYRFLMTRASGTNSLVLLVVFHKNDADDLTKENRFYKLAERRLIQGSY